MTDTATTRRSDRLTFVCLLLINTVTVGAAYAVVVNDENIRVLAAATLLVVVIIAQTIHNGPLLTVLSWVSTMPVAVVMAVLIVAYPALDWSGPGEADQIRILPIVPVITVLYAIGFTLVSAAAYWLRFAFRDHYSRKSR